MADDRQELEALVSQAYTRSPLTFDLLVSAFLQALHSHRRPSVCTPFPTSLFATRHGEKDFVAAEVAIQEVSKHYVDLGATRLGSLHESSKYLNLFAKLPLESLKLMQWLLRFRYKVCLVGDPALELPKQIFSRLFGSRRNAVALSGLLPDYILKLEEPDARPCTAFDESRSQFGSIFAFHGTSAENLHSILRCGLLILSNSSLQRNGAIFGEGIYLSSDPAVALGFSKPGIGWECSSFGQHARYLLLCEVAKGDQVLCSDTDHTPGASSKNHEKGLGTYIIVQNCDLLKLRFVFVYAGPSRDRVVAGEYVEEELLPTRGRQDKLSGFSLPRRINWCKVIIFFYALLLMGIAFLNSSSTAKFATKLHRK